MMSLVAVTVTLCLLHQDVHSWRIDGDRQALKLIPAKNSLDVKLGLMNEEEMFPKDVAETRDERTRERDVMASLYPWYDLPRASRRFPKEVSIPEPEQKTVTKIS